MKSKQLAALVTTAWIATTGLGLAQVAGERIPGRYIVILKPGANANAVALAHGVRPDFVYTDALNGFAGVVPARRLQALARHQDVAWVEEDQVVTADVQTLPSGINRIGADASSTANINNVDQPRVDVDIAIIDTGIELNHPDLNVYKNVSFVSGAKTGNDDHGHGTHVAGTAAALDNAAGVVGVAPGARLWAVKVLNRNGSGTISGVIKGVDYVTSKAAEIEVANMSLGGGDSPSLKAAIANSAAAGIVYAVAAGNSNADAAGASPANSPEVLCVSAIADSDGICGGLGLNTSYGADDTRATFSNWGSTVDIAAPGVNILSTYKGKSYAIMSGTSMASPHVAGAAGLYIAGQIAAAAASVPSGSFHKPSNADEAAAVRQAIINAATPQSDPCGFSGDADGSAEPLLNAAGF